MAHEILAAKLCEMDDEFAKLHSRIRMSDKLSEKRMQEEISRLEVEIEDQMNLIHKSLIQSRAEISEKLLDQFEVLKDRFSSALCGVEEEINSCGDEEFKNEKQILAAEYSVDFAIIVAKIALLKALEASAAADKEEQAE